MFNIYARTICQFVVIFFFVCLIVFWFRYRNECFCKTRLFLTVVEICFFSRRKKNLHERDGWRMRNWRETASACNELLNSDCSSLEVVSNRHKKCRTRSSRRSLCLACTYSCIVCERIKLLYKLAATILKWEYAFLESKWMRKLLVGGARACPIQIQQQQVPFPMSTDQFTWKVFFFSWNYCRHRHSSRAIYLVVYEKGGKLQPGTA